VKFYLTASEEERFWARINPGLEDECWRFGNCQFYGKMNLKWCNGGTLGAHAIMYLLIYGGTIPDGYDVCHTCDHKWCINPWHLFLGTHEENMQDCVKKDRHSRGERNGQAKLSEDKVKMIFLLLAKGYSQRNSRENER
jgi:hypothetical protein